MVPQFPGFLVDRGQSRKPQTDLREPVQTIAVTDNFGAVFVPTNSEFLCHMRATKPTADENTCRLIVFHPGFNRPQLICGLGRPWFPNPADRPPVPRSISLGAC
jgi:hypothetical protein